MSNIEFISGSESHTSNWGKFYVKGLERWECKEDYTSDRHHRYMEFCCNDIPEGVVFTVFSQSGDKKGTDNFLFSICVTDDGAFESWEASKSRGRVVGNFRYLVEADTKTKSPRLMEWWNQRSLYPWMSDIEFADYLAQFIDKRGCSNFPVPVKPEVAQ